MFLSMLSLPRRLNLSAWLIASVLAALLSGCCTIPPEHKDQKAFDSADSAVKALSAAVRKGDTAEMIAIFGPDAQELLTSGDPVADKRNREVFAVAIEQEWKLDNLQGDSKELVVGYEQWPFPIPLVKECWGWRFDTAAGKQEVLARRIGRNELSAVGVCQTYILAQKEYAKEGRDGKPAGIYAQKVQSEPGKHDGLYWATSNAGEKASPLGDLAAQAESEGYTPAAKNKPRPFRGYYFRILTEQGQDARGGAKSYLVTGDMKDGFALIAYPAEYGNSGIMTFIVNHDGVIHESDLGEDTLKIGSEIKAYNPDSQWRVVE